MNEFKTIEANYSRYTAIQAEANERNKARTFEVLNGANITGVLVIFGGGDDGQIEAVVAFTGEAETPIPQAAVEIEYVSWGSAIPTVDHELQLAEAIETLCYGYLSQRNTKVLRAGADLFAGPWRVTDSHGSQVRKPSTKTLPQAALRRAASCISGTHSHQDRRIARS